ncbi:MAG TPA: hypothetical protein VN885_02350, partial [Candidatus Acidoferrales bacterium]|nr:hypothetical protein [Candidatus Acidoferrales bacterium]
MRRQHTIENQPPRDPNVSAAEVIAHLATLTEAASIRQIAHGMDLNHRGRRYLPRVITQLKRSGDVEELYGGRYRLSEQGNSPRASPHRAPAERTSPQAAAEPASRRVAAQAPAGRVVSPQPARARDPNLIAGRIVAHRDGYGFLVPDHPIPRVDGDLFIGRDGLGDAMNGDHALARVERRRADGRAEGRVVQIVEREHVSI